jgi:cysteine desulfurase/selenocysteine lyase
MMNIIVEKNKKIQTANFDITSIRNDFPILQEKINGQPLVYLDNAATTQKPKAVIDAITNYYLHTNSNVHRGIHSLSERASAAYENARKSVQQFINAKHLNEIIFVSGTTEAINLIAHTYGACQIQPGDEILVSAMEHHSNLVPWQMLCEAKGAVLKIIPITTSGELDYAQYEKLFSAHTKLVAVTHLSNVLGTINPIAEITRIAHEHDAVVVVDGAQAVSHLAVDVQALDCDFYVFSGHKLYAPTGIGVLYGKKQSLEKMPPYQTGGGMISHVTFEKTNYAELPEKFEAGTPNIAGAIGLHASINYIQNLGLENISLHEQQVFNLMHAELNKIKNLKMVGNASGKTAVISFVLDNIHPHDIATILDSEGVAIRAGHHCAEPLMNQLGLTSTARVSLGLYNSEEEIERLLIAIAKAQRIFK